MDRSPTHISGHMELLSKNPDLWFWVFQAPPKGVPVTPHYLSLDVALAITVMADSDSVLDCQTYSEGLLSLYTSKC